MRAGISRERGKFFANPLSFLKDCGKNEREKLSR